MGGSSAPPEKDIASLPDAIPYDDALTAIADSERRQILDALRQLETPERVSALTRWLAAETGTSAADEVERIHLRLHHVHVPKLADVGAVSYDRDRRTVELTDEGRRLADSVWMTGGR